MQNWIAGHFEQPVWFFNDIGRHTRDVFTSRNGHTCPLPSLPPPFSVANSCSSHRSLLMYSYEDDPLDALTEISLDEIGGAKKTYNVLLLRDALNNLASRLRYKETVGGFGLVDRPRIFIRRWKQYAKEFLGETAHLGGNLVVINYNRWVTRRAYRAEIAHALGKDLNDATLAQVPMQGFGSSFDGVVEDGRKLDVLNRWQAYARDKRLRPALEDRELRELTTEIFGPEFWPDG